MTLAVNADLGLREPQLSRTVKSIQPNEGNWARSKVTPARAPGRPIRVHGGRVGQSADNRDAHRERAPVHPQPAGEVLRVAAVPPAREQRTGFCECSRETRP